MIVHIIMQGGVQDTMYTMSPLVVVDHSHSTDSLGGVLDCVTTPHARHKAALGVTEPVK